jgi:enoyl-CoA hydratase/carnithine racemase
MDAAPWVAMCVLQKAIRRGRKDLALSAAAHLAPGRAGKALAATIYDLQREAGRTDDFVEGVRAFLEKRQANFGAAKGGA